MKFSFISRICFFFFHFQNLDSLECYISGLMFDNKSLVKVFEHPR